MRGSRHDSHTVRYVTYTFQSKEPKMTHACSNTISSDMRYPFDARGVAKRFRHAAIFGALDSLNPGETMSFCNDHDPLPLLTQLALSLIHISEPTRLGMISYAVF